MDELLSAVLDAHGGLDNWQNVRTLTVRFSRGGPFWAARGWPILANEKVTLDAHREHIEFTPAVNDESSEPACSSSGGVRSCTGWSSMADGGALSSGTTDCKGTGREGGGAVETVIRREAGCSWSDCWYIF